MALTKTDIVDALSKDLRMTKNGSFEVVETVLDLIKKNLAEGEDVLISGFGKFCVRDKKQRKGRNPQSGAEMTLSRRRVVTFQCSGKLRNKINRKT
jgi:integration host factor subunit alpha